MPSDARDRRVNAIDHRWSDLWRQEREWARGILHYLFFTNAGGAIATLSFLASSTNTPGSVKGSLAFFLLGLVLVGAVVLWGFHHIGGVFKGWREDTSSHIDGKISWADVNRRDDARANDPKLAIWLAWSSFACFVIGAFVGVLSIVLL